MASAAERARTGAVGESTTPDASDDSVSLLDRFLPDYDVRERHAVTVAAAPSDVYQAISTADLARHPLVRALLGARAIPSALMGRGRREGARQIRAPLTIDALCRLGFAVLAVDPPREIVLGLTGRFWRPAGGLLRTDPATFASSPHPGAARAAWSFSVEPLGSGHTTLLTETRVHCTDAASRRRFRVYWLFVRPGSGLIRRYMLDAIRHEAIRSSASGGPR